MNENPKKILIVVAHPDDADVIAGSTIAYWTAEGAEVELLVCTDGGKGSSSQNADSSSVTLTRKQEQENAAKILGIKNVDYLDHKDCEINCDMKLKEQIVRHIRAAKPDIVLTFDPSFLYSIEDNYINHHDHRMVGQASIDSVYPLARDRLSFPEHEQQGLEPHKVTTLLLFNPEKSNYFVDSEKYFEIQVKAICEHKSQFDNPHSFAEKLKQQQERLADKTDYKQCEGFVKVSLN